MDQLDRNIYDTDPNENYEVLERTLKEVHTECFPVRIVRFNDNKHKNSMDNYWDSKLNKS